MTVAAAALLDSRGGFEQDCSRCTHDPELRQRWGCDGPTADETATIVVACPDCHGRRTNCTACGGTGELVVRQCPWRWIRPEHSEVVLAGVRMEHGVLPAPGGWHDQAHTFCEAYLTARNEIAFWRHKAQERAAKER